MPLTLASNTTARAYECRYCTRAYEQQKTLNRHIRSIHRNAKYACPMCHRTFNRLDIRNRHTAEQHLDRADTKVICERCSKTVGRRSLQAHVSSKACTEQLQAEATGLTQGDNTIIPQDIGTYENFRALIIVDPLIIVIRFYLSITLPPIYRHDHGYTFVGRPWRPEEQLSISQLATGLDLAYSAVRGALSRGLETLSDYVAMRTTLLVLILIESLVCHNYLAVSLHLHAVKKLRAPQHDLLLGPAMIKLTHEAAHEFGLWRIKDASQDWTYCTWDGHRPSRMAFAWTFSRDLNVH